MTPRTSTPQRWALAIVTSLCLVACGSDDAPTSTGASSTAAQLTTTAPVTTAPGTTTTSPPTTIAPTTTLTPITPTAPASTTTNAPTTSTAAPALEQPAIWPAPDVVFASPEEAAADFVAQILGVPPTLGEFQQADSRSGEIGVFSPGEGDAGVWVERGLLLLRRLGPDDGWFVLGATSSGATITTPEAGAVVPVAALTVEGAARGFEATVVVTAWIAGHAGEPLDQQITMGGSTETVEPFNVTLDLSGTTEGDTIMVLVRGDTGLETDPGEFTAIPLTVGS